MNDGSNQSSPRRVGLALALAGIGAATSAYLLWRHVAPSEPASGFCRMIFGPGCDAARQSDWASFLGVPLGGWGLVHFSVVSALLLLAVVIGDDFRTEGLVAALLVSVAAAVVGVVLTIAMLTHEQFCPLCLVVHLANLLLVPAIILASGQPLSRLIASLWHGVQYLAGSAVVDPKLARWKVTGLFTAAFVGIIVYQWVQIQVDRAVVLAKAKPAIDIVLAEFDATPLEEIPIENATPRLGSSSALVSLTVFSDLECPACRAFAKSLQRPRLNHPEVSVVLRHFPLSSACNSAVHSDLHPHSCQAALAAIAAQRQGRFWQFHDAAFAISDKLDDATLLTLAKNLGLDLDRFDAERHDDNSHLRLTADVTLGAQLKVDGTPTVFVNGRRISSNGMPFLNEIVEHELANALKRTSGDRR